MIVERLQRAIIRQKYRDDVISRISAMRDSGESILSISQSLELPETTVRNIIKKIL